MNKIEFSELEVLIDEKSPTIQDFEYVDSNSIDNFLFNDVHYLVSTSILNQEYFWFYARHGKRLPRSEIIVDTQTHSEEKIRERKISLNH